MRKTTMLLILLTGIFSMAVAQKSAVTAGVIAYQNGETGKAIEKLTEGIANPDLFPDKKMKFYKKGQYYLALAFARAANDTTLSKLYPDAALNAAKLLSEGTSGEYGAAWKKAAQVDNANEQVANAAFNQGISVYNSDVASTDTENNFDRAEPYFEYSSQLKPKYFMTKYLLGNIKLNKAQPDTTAGIEMLSAGIDVYKDLYLNGDPNQMMLNKTLPGSAFLTDSSYVVNAYELLAAVLDLTGDSVKALATISEGIELFPEAENLARRELAIYNQHPSMFEEAKAKFEKAIVDRPDDLPIKLAYANMLDRQGDTQRAFELFKDVSERNPDDITALFQLGRYYNNLAVQAEKKKNELSTRASDAEYEAAEEAIKVELRQAMPYFKKLHELQPNEAEWLRILVNITSRLSENDLMNEYYEKLKVVQDSGN